MRSTLQTEGMNILEHGLSVWNFTRKLLDNDTEGMKIPPWFTGNQEFLLENCYDRTIIKQYTIFHDIGKPYTLCFDEHGRRHFPNHTEVSQKIWMDNNWCPIAGQLIGLDMIFHIETPEQILSRKLDAKILCTLMISALAELHANAEMFGGIKSESFCIKYKKLEKRARKILTHLTNGRK